VLTKSKGVLLASALALAAAGGSVAVIRAESAGSVNAASSALPMPAGSPVTATVPSNGAGSADGTGSGAGGSAASGSGGTGSVGTGSVGTGSAGTGADSGPAASGAQADDAAADRSRVDSTLPTSAGQGRPGPLPAGTLPADGAVPGASQSVRALAAARSATTALPHSPQLLGQLAGPGGWTGTAGSASPPAAGEPAGTASDPPAGATATGDGSDGDGSGGAGNSPTPATSAPTRSSTPTAPAAATAQVAQTAAASLAGLDVAAYQHPVTRQDPKGVPIDWQQVAAAGYRFAAVKSTEGDYYVNRWAATDLAEAKAAGLDVSPYHFAIPNESSGPDQAEYAVEYSGYAPGAQTLPLMLDIEYDPYTSTDGTNECYGLSPSRMTAWISGFVATTRSLTGQYPIIYTTANWWDTCTGRSTAFGADPMWVAAYGFSAPPLPAGWANWSYWQYTSGGTVPGVDSTHTTDLDSFGPSAVALIDPGTLASRPLGRVSVPISSLGALAGEKLTWTASGLPPGVRMTAGGVLAGLITGSSFDAAAGPVTYLSTVTAKNAAGGSSSVIFDWQVAASCPGYLSFGPCPEK
jgi:GH25 family lysozyme M1 (1,4-beta-N-acetylmuramidase)